MCVDNIQQNKNILSQIITKKQVYKASSGQFNINRLKSIQNTLYLYLRLGGIGIESLDIKASSVKNSENIKPYNKGEF